MRLAFLALTVALTSACTALPSGARLEVEHVSHPLAGWPVSAKNTEDGLSQANAILRWQRGRTYVEQGLGYNLKGENGGGFYGPELTYTARFGVELWSRQ
jgi:hypothetical protein